jgi:hypothetical protein
MRWQNLLKGNVMSKSLESMSIEQLLVEADDLIRQIHSDAIKDMEEEDLLRFEKHAQYLKNARSDVQATIGKEKNDKMNSGAEGMHEAISDIVKAMRGMKKYLSRFPLNAFE